jgi:hypothetical protein
MGRKQLHLRVSDEVGVVIEQRAATRGLSVAEFLTEMVEAGIKKDAAAVAVLELMPSVKAELKRTSLAAARSVEERLVRASFEATLTRMLVTKLYERLLPEVDVDALIEQVLPAVEERTRHPLRGLEDLLRANLDADLPADPARDLPRASSSTSSPTSSPVASEPGLEPSGQAGSEAAPSVPGED